ncbi:MAG: tellurite resistance protein TerC [Sphingobacteriales bacterium]|jgi:tellurite resistance protein TerC
MPGEIFFFGGFALLIAFFLALDLGVFNKKDHVVSFKEALSWTALWVSLALGFFFFIRFNGNLLHGISNMDELLAVVSKYEHVLTLSGDYASDLKLYLNVLSTEFITGYLLEYALSVDNIFVILLIFSAFGVQEKYYHKILFWGILGAVVMRFIFIFLGAALISEFAWILYVFGAFLIYSGVMMFIHRKKEEKVDTANHPVVKIASKFFSVSKEYKDSHFWFRENGKLIVTPLFLVLLVVEFSDLIFAVDSIPAIFGITKDPYVVFFSNIFAILGLRSMFFLLMNVMDKFHYLKSGLAILLVFIGAKMLAHHPLKELGFTTNHSLLIIALILGLSVVLSLVIPKKETT